MWLPTEVLVYITDITVLIFFTAVFVLFNYSSNGQAPLSQGVFTPGRNS